MVFSSPFFLFVFLPIVIFLIWIARKSLHNTILLCASLFFYSWGSIAQTPIFIFSILINYLFGNLISRTEGKKAKFFLVVAVIINLSLLGYFKYFNFFIENINAILSSTGSRLIIADKVALPIGISFFTFHALSYVIDVYRRKVGAQKNLLDLALYISFFPQLIAGPIVRYIDVADQFKNRVLSLEKASVGTQRFIFGFAKKVIVANTMAYLADQIFALPSNQISPGVAWLGALAYTFQIYFDFSGYSDMAIGLAKIFGFNFPENFNYPYIAQSIKDFWRRWHISLSTWFRDFLYIPLGGNRGSEMRTIFNLLFVFFCTGFWHGASWNFIFWGMFHGVFLLLERTPFNNFLFRIWKPLRITYTFFIVVIGWIFFRSDNLENAFKFLGRMSFLSSGAQIQNFMVEFLDAKIIFLFSVAILYSFGILRWSQRKLEESFARNDRQNVYQMIFTSGKFAVSMSLFFLAITYLAASTYNPFIYFRF
jgi:alginate O-acetyltransferase complex protein AlgI